MTFKVDFLGIGAPKAATTWLDSVLREHPEIIMSREKEVNFFSDYIHFTDKEKTGNYEKGIEWYGKQFPFHAEKRKVGEVSPSYIWNEVAPKRISKHNDNIKIISIIREPVSRAHSHYMYCKHYLMIEDSESFEEAIKKKKGYIQLSKYYPQLKRYYDLFPNNNILILTLDDIKDRPKTTLKKLYGFLGIKKNYNPRSLKERKNKAKKTKSVLVIKAINKINNIAEFLNNRDLSFVNRIFRFVGMPKIISLIQTKWNTKDLEKEHLNPKTKERLRETFKEDVEKTQKLIGRNLLQEWSYE